MKVRTIITQDAEVDDQNSLRHFLFYSNEVELQGIVQTSSVYHWRGIPGADARKKPMRDRANHMPESSFEAPYRWPGTDWMQRVIDDYEKDYPNLMRHATGYPSPEYLRSITKVGNIGYVGEVETPTEGSELIRRAILDDDDRKLYIQAWGGCNTIARALMDIQAQYEAAPQWTSLKKRISEKVVITACGEQDETYRTYIAEVWPNIQFVKMLQMGSYAYFWPTMPDGESKDSLRADFMKREILNGKSALAGGYCTWLDGTYYEGEAQDTQFGANPNIANEWVGTRIGVPAGVQYDFLSEGDSPTFFPLLNWGFRTLEDFSYGGIAGRYHRVADAVNSKLEKLNLWNTSKDIYTDKHGQTHLTESMWPYVADIQRDFAARVEWASADCYEKGEHAPALRVTEGTDLTARAGETVILHTETSSPDLNPVHTTFRIYKDVSADWAQDYSLEFEHGTAAVVIPPRAVPGDVLHIIVKAQAEGHHRLVRYQQVIVTVE